MLQISHDINININEVISDRISVKKLLYIG